MNGLYLEQFIAVHDFLRELAKAGGG